MKLRKADQVFSAWIKKRDKYTCQRCDKIYPVKWKGLHNSHFIGRRNEATRFLPENCDALCYGCHSWFGQNREEYRKWKMKKLGEECFNVLMARKNSIIKKINQEE